MNRIQYKEYCRRLYPIQYRASSIVQIIPGLPLRICNEIHQLRSIEDLQISTSNVNEILGFSDSNPTKNQYLDRVLTPYLRLYELDPIFRDDKHVVMIICLRNGLFLENASERLRNDDEVVNVAVYSNHMAMRFAGLSIRSDKTRMLIACKEDGFIFEHICPTLQDDIDITTVACTGIEGHLSCLGWASSRLRNDRSFVASIWKKHKLVYAYAGDELKADKNFAMTVCRDDPYSYRWVAPQLQEDEELIILCLRTPPYYGDILNLIPETVWSNSNEVVYVVLTLYPYFHIRINKNLLITEDKRILHLRLTTLCAIIDTKDISTPLNTLRLYKSLHISILEDSIFTLGCLLARRQTLNDEIIDLLQYINFDKPIPWDILKKVSAGAYIRLFELCDRPELRRAAQDRVKSEILKNDSFLSEVYGIAERMNKSAKRRWTMIIDYLDSELRDKTKLREMMESV